MNEVPTRFIDLTKLGVNFLVRCIRTGSEKGCCSFNVRSRLWAGSGLGAHVADGASGGAADPAFEVHVSVVYMWVLAVWERCRSK